MLFGKTMEPLECRATLGSGSLGVELEPLLSSPDSVHALIFASR